MCLIKYVTLVHDTATGYSKRLLVLKVMTVFGTIFFWLTMNIIGLFLARRSFQLYLPCNYHGPARTFSTIKRKTTKYFSNCSVDCRCWWRVSILTFNFWINYRSLLKNFKNGYKFIHIVTSHLVSFLFLLFYLILHVSSNVVPLHCLVGGVGSDSESDCILRVCTDVVSLMVLLLGTLTAAQLWWRWRLPTRPLYSEQSLLPNISRCGAGERRDRVILLSSHLALWQGAHSGDWVWSEIQDRPWELYFSYN